MISIYEYIGGRIDFQNLSSLFMGLQILSVSV